MFVAGVEVMALVHTYKKHQLPALERPWASWSAGAAPEGVEAGIATKMAIGFTAGGLAQLIAVPFDVIKVRMQSDGRLVAQGKLAAPRYAGVADALGRRISGDEAREIGKQVATVKLKAKMERIKVEVS